MKARIKFAWRWAKVLAAATAALALTTLPALAQESQQPDITDTTVGTVFRWVNFALVAGGLIFVFAKVFAPLFRKHAGEISGSIRQASEERAEARRQLTEAEQQLAGVAVEVEELKKAAARETAEERERIAGLAQAESERVAKAAQAEIAAAERAAGQELRAIAARLATEGAAALLRQQLNAQVEAMIFRSFVTQLPRSAS